MSFASVKTDKCLISSRRGSVHTEVDDVLEGELELGAWSADVVDPVYECGVSISVPHAYVAIFTPFASKEIVHYTLLCVIELGECLRVRSLRVQEPTVLKQAAYKSQSIRACCKFRMTYLRFLSSESRAVSRLARGGQSISCCVASQLYTFSAASAVDVTR